MTGGRAVAEYACWWPLLLGGGRRPSAEGRPDVCCWGGVKSGINAPWELIGVAVGAGYRRPAANDLHEKSDFSTGR